MWRSQSDLLTMAQEHNRDLVRQAEAERLNRHLNGTLGSRIKKWWESRSPAMAIRQWFPQNTRGRVKNQVEYREQY
jgi:hypothetical protein